MLTSDCTIRTSQYLLRFGDMVEQFTELRKSLHLILKVSQSNGLNKKSAKARELNSQVSFIPVQLSFHCFIFLFTWCVLVSLHIINFFGLIPDMVNFILLGTLHSCKYSSSLI